uniref:Similar to Os02g0672700 n=1 Tax=Arundo donax TaxID=35708 RepID=A0A0A9EDB7_ARUDO
MVITRSLTCLKGISTLKTEEAQGKIASSKISPPSMDTRTLFWNTCIMSSLARQLIEFASA